MADMGFGRGWDGNGTVPASPPGEGWRAWSLVLALVVYGGLSAPAPAELRWAELFIGAVLILGVGWLRPLSVVTGHALTDDGGARWETPALLALGWLLWAPLLRGVWLGWAPGDMLRDVVPLFYLFLPVLLAPGLRRAGPGAAAWLSLGLALAGLAFALRWWKQVHWGFGAVGQRVMSDGGVYLLNAPSVLFAAIALPLSAFGLAMRGGPPRWCLAALCAAGGVLCLAALAGAVHRMALGMAALAFAAVGLWWARRTPGAVALAAGTAALAVALVAPAALLGAIGEVAAKTRLAGTNSRLDEAAMVLLQAVASPADLLTGQGWGALLANPAVGGWRVSYTHTLATYILAKAGVLGALALAVYLAGFLHPLRTLLREDPPLAWAILPPLAMAMGLHTSFKYLDTGLLLTLLALAAERRNRLCDRRR